MAAQKKPTPKKKPNPNARGTKKPAERPAEKPAERQQEPPKPPQDTANQFWSIMLFALGVLSLLLIVIPGTSAWHVLHTTMFGLFGVASAFIPLILVYTAILIGMERSHQTVSGKAFWGVALMILSSAIVQIFFYGEVKGDGLVDCVRTLFRQGKDLQGGGVFSALIAWPLIRLFDVTGAKIIILLMLFVFVMLLTNTGLIDLFRLLSRPFRKCSGAAPPGRSGKPLLWRTQSSPGVPGHPGRRISGLMCPLWTMPRCRRICPSRIPPSGSGSAVPEIRCRSSRSRKSRKVRSLRSWMTW